MIDGIFFVFLKITLAVLWKINCTAVKVDVVGPFTGLLQKTKGRWKYLRLNMIAVEVLWSGQIEDAFERKTDML